jgi:hypothetical protein
MTNAFSAVRKSRRFAARLLVSAVLLLPCGTTSGGTAMAQDQSVDAFGLLNNTQPCTDIAASMRSWHQASSIRVATQFSAEVPEQEQENLRAYARTMTAKMVAPLGLPLNDGPVPEADLILVASGSRIYDTMQRDITIRTPAGITRTTSPSFLGTNWKGGLLIRGQATCGIPVMIETKESWRGGLSEFISDIPWERAQLRSALGAWFLEAYKKLNSVAHFEVDQPAVRAALLEFAKEFELSSHNAKVIMELIGDQQYLVGVYRDTSNPHSVRAAAVSKLNDQSLLYEIYRKERFDIKSYALSAITDQARLKQIVQSSDDSSARRSAAWKIQDDKFLASLAVHEKIEDVATAMLYNICDPALLRDIATSADLPGIRLRALYGLPDKELLARFSKNDPDKGVRSKAKDLLSSLAKEGDERFRLVPEKRKVCQERQRQPER